MGNSSSEFARIGLVDFADKEIGESTKAMQIVRVGLGLVLQILFEVPQAVPGKKIRGERRFAVVRKDPLNIRHVIHGMKGGVEMPASPECKPLLKSLPIPMESVKILEVVKGEEEIRDAFRFPCVEGCAVVVIPLIEIKISPDLNGFSVVLFFCSNISFTEISECSRVCNSTCGNHKI